MKVLVRYNDCVDPALHSTIGIVVRGGLLPVVNRNPTARDIIKKFIKSYNNLIKGYGTELTISTVHLAIKKEGTSTILTDTNNEDDYIALPSDLLLSQCMIETDTTNNGKSDNGPTKNVLYVRHGKSHTQASFLLLMKDQIRYAIQEEIRSVSSPTTTTVSNSSNTNRTIPNPMSNNNNITENSKDTQMSTKSHQRQSIDNTTYTSGGTVSILTEQRDDEQQQNQYGSHNIDYANTKEDVDDEEQHPEALITNMESLQTIDSINTTTFVDGLKLASPNEILRMVQDENEKLDAYGNSQHINMLSNNEDSIRSNLQQTEQRNESAEMPEIKSSEDGQTTWLQFKRVMHSFGVDSVVYKDVVDEIRKSKRKQQQQQQQALLSTNKYRGMDGKMIVSSNYNNTNNYNNMDDDTIVLDKSIKNHLGTVFTKNFVSLRKNNINTTEEDDILYHDIEFELENTTNGTSNGGKNSTIITSTSMRNNNNNNQNTINKSIFDVNYWWNNTVTLRPTAGNNVSSSLPEQQQQQSSSTSSSSHCGFCTFNE